jgi:hypothetical protein
VTALDDLLAYDEEPPARPRRRRRVSVGTAVTDLLVAAALTALIVMGLRAAELSMPVAVVFAVVLALRLLLRVVGSLPLAPAVHRERPVDPNAPEVPPDGLYTASSRWQNRLDAGWREAARFESVVLPHLVEIVDERLRQRHGVSRDADPVRARALVGEPLWTFLRATGRTAGPSPRELAEMVALMEQV